MSQRHDAADLAAFADGLARAGLRELSSGYAELVASFATNGDLRALAASGGPGAVLLSDDPAITGLQKQNKEFVTHAEQRAELVMRELVRQRFPGDAVVGEELGAVPGNERIWVFDPVDGTSAMVRTALAEAFGAALPSPAPAFGITIAVIDSDVARVGVVGELRTAGGGLALTRVWVGADGQPTTCDGRPVSCDTPVALAAAALACTVPEVMFSAFETWSGYQALADATRAVETDQNCVGFMRLLGDGIDVVVERDLTLPDAAALLPVLVGAGIVVTDHQGAPVRFDAASRDGEYALLAAAPGLHGDALAVLRAGVAPVANRFVAPAGPQSGYAKKFAE